MRARDVFIWACLPLAVAVMLVSATLTGTTTPALLVGPGDLVAYSETRAAKRYELAVDRDGDAELRAYNARLSALDEHTHDPRRTP